MNYRGACPGTGTSQHCPVAAQNQQSMCKQVFGNEMRSSLNDRVHRWAPLCLLLTQCRMRELFVGNVPFFFLSTFLVVTGTSSCQTIIPCAFISPAASSFSFCRPAVEYRALPEDFKHQLSRRTGGNLTWHDGRGQKTAGGRTVKLLQQPGTEALQVRLATSTSI